MGLVIDQDSVEDMLFDLNRDNTNKSIYAKQFGINSLNQQVAQSSIDEVYSQQLMNSYQTYLQNRNMSNSNGMIDSLRKEVDQYNYDALSKAYETSMKDRVSDTYDVYNKYLEAQGYIGDELVSLAGAYGKRADSFLDYMKITELDPTIKDYLTKTGIIVGEEETVDADGNTVISNKFVDDSVIRNKMFVTETQFDEQGNVIANKGDLTEEGRAILNMLQSNYTKDDASEKRELSYDAWIEDQDKYKDERIDKDVMRKMLGIESEYGRTYTKREMMNISQDYRTAVANAENAKLDQVKLENNTAYQAILSGNDVRISSDDVKGIDDDFNKTISSIKESLAEYGFTEEEFNEFLKSEGLNFTLDTVGESSLEELSKNVVTEGELSTETWKWVEYGTAMATGTTMAAIAAAHTSAALASYAATPVTFGASAALGAYETSQAVIAGAASVAAFALADNLYAEASEYGKSLDQKVRQMVPFAKDLGNYYGTIKEKFDKFMKEVK